MSSNGSTFTLSLKQHFKMKLKLISFSTHKKMSPKQLFITFLHINKSISCH